MTLARRLFLRLGIIQEPELTDFTALDPEIQIAVATEAALAAAVDLIVLQKIAWNELCDNLAEMGCTVSVAPQAQERYDEIMKRLNAAMIVAGENVGVPDEVMRGLRRDRP